MIWRLRNATMSPGSSSDAFYHKDRRKTWDIFLGPILYQGILGCFVSMSKIQECTCHRLIYLAPTFLWETPISQMIKRKFRDVRWLVSKIMGPELMNFCLGNLSRDRIFILKTKISSLTNIIFCNLTIPLKVNIIINISHLGSSLNGMSFKMNWSSPFT